MKLKKTEGQFNTYAMEISWGELEAIRGALETDHADPVRDELFAGIDWYIDNVPKPGEDKEDLKAREEQEKEVAELGAEEAGEENMIPPPPGSEFSPESELGPEAGAGPEPGLEPGSEPGPGLEVEEEPAPER
jgi:hypothetical protein